MPPTISANPAAPTKRRAGLRRLSRDFVNRFTLLFAGKRVYAALEHRGRRSGRLFRAPVVAMPTPDGFVIPLTFGPDADWVLNIVAAGRCAITLGGRTVTAGSPEVIGKAEAMPYFHGWVAWAIRRWGTAQFLRLRTIE